MLLFLQEARAAAEGTSSTTDFIEGEAAKEMTENIEYLYVGREDDDDQVSCDLILLDEWIG